MAIELHHLQAQAFDVAGKAIDEISRLRAENDKLKADYDRLLSTTHKERDEYIDMVASKDKEIAEIKQQYNDMDIAHTVHIAKMNAKIEELKAKNAQLEDDVAFWKKKLSSCLNGDCILTCDTVEKYGKENVRLKRALYKACAMWADRTRLICSVFGSDAPRIRWERMLGRCRAMAEKFGG